MAELGRVGGVFPESGPQAATDPAAGGGAVTITVEGIPFVHNTSAGQTVDEILEALAALINNDPDYAAVHEPDSVEITVTATNSQEVSSLAIQISDVGFGFLS